MTRRAARRVTGLRIGYVLNVFPKLSETFIAWELAELSARGVEVLVCSQRRPTEGLRHRIVDRAGLLEHTLYDPDEFLPALARFRPHLLHAHFAREPAAAARELAARLGVPFTFTAHAYDIYRRPPPDWGERAAAAAAVITVSEANARHIEASFAVPRSHLRVIPCGVDTERFSPGREPKPPGPPLIVCVARLRPVKNQALLLDACARLRTGQLEFRCVLVGDGSEAPQLSDLAGRLGLDGVVELAGPAEQDEVLAWWRRAAVAALPSTSEGMPVSLMEAAACGVPAVATAVGGVPELVVDGETGFVVPPGDSQAMGGALARLLGDESLRASMGAAARRRVQACFTVAASVDRLLGLWSEVAAGAT